MRVFSPLLPLAALALGAGAPRSAPVQKTYIYQYYDKAGNLVINNLPPSYVRGQGLTLKSVGVGHVRLAISRSELARALKSPELIALVDEIASANGVDVHLARAIIQAESAFNYRARSHTGALGLMQLMPKTAQRFGVLDPFDPRQNIMGGTKYLRWLMDYYKGDHTRVIAAYNAGEGAVDRYRGVPPYRETRAYVPKVMDLFTKRLVQADPKAKGGMDALKKGRGGFRVDDRPLGGAREVAEARPEPATHRPIFRWVDAAGRTQISDQPPPKGARSLKVYTGEREG